MNSYHIIASNYHNIFGNVLAVSGGLAIKQMRNVPYDYPKIQHPKNLMNISFLIKIFFVKLQVSGS